MRKSTLLAISTVSFSALAIGATSAKAAQSTTASDPACVPNGAGKPGDHCISGEIETKSAQDASKGGNTSDQAIIVTGSRIRRPNLTSNVPVTTVSNEDLTSRGQINVGDALNDLPSLRSTFNQSNSTRFIGTAGVNVLDLRGLGTVRTLVLVNGRRHVTYTPGNFLVDVNTIPTDLIERVDIVTGGSSAVYGSDAVAGVVNFILRKDFNGLRLRGQGAISSHHDRGAQFISLTGGKNFLDSRANVAFNAEYSHAEPLYFTDRNDQTGAFTGRCQFNSSSFSAGEAPSGNGIPDQTFSCGTRNATISNGGTLTALSPVVRIPNSKGVLTNTTLACTDPRLATGSAFASIGAARCLNAGSDLGQTRIFRFDGSGNLLQDIPLTDFRPFGQGTIIGDPNSPVPGSSLRDTGQIAPGLNRYSFNVLSHIDVSDALKPFVEAKFVRVDALQQGQPSFFQGTFPGFFGTKTQLGGRGIRCDNPFLTAQNFTALQSIGRCAGGPTSTETIRLGRFNVDFGGRSEIVRRDTYRIVGGVTGTFNGDWNYEVSLNYGHVKTKQTENNDLQVFDINGNEAGFLNATDAVRNSSGQIVCRINATTVTDPRCVPINLFGNGAPSQAALDYVNTTSFVKSKASELDALAFVGGDSSQVFNLPGGPISFVIGGEYRREKASRFADPLSASGGTFFNAFKPFDPPKFSVKEAFGEIQIPLLRDLPFAKELSFSGAGRISKYNTSAGTTKAYNLSGVYAPISDIRFRANLSRSVRVPTLGDLFSPASQNFGFVDDPCDVQNIGNGTANRRANCAALGVPVGFVNAPARSQTIGFLSAGNPELRPEVGKSLTLGTVITPRFIPGFSFTVDYYRIRVNKLIATLTAQQILNTCVDLPSLSNQYCASTFARNSDSTFATPALLSKGLNFAKQKADGIDFELAYRKTFANGHKFDFHGIMTKVIRRINFTSPTDPSFGDRIESELGEPAYAANVSVGYQANKLGIRYSANYFSHQTIGAYENYFAFEGRPPQNADLTAEIYYPSALYHAVKVTFDATKKFQFYVGVDNLTNKKPPFGLVGNEGGNPYDPFGRYMYAGAKVDF